MTFGRNRNASIKERRTRIMSFPIVDVVTQGAPSFQGLLPGWRVMSWAPPHRMYRTPDGCRIRGTVKIGRDPQPLVVRLLDEELLSRSSVVSGRLLVVSDT